MSRSMWQMTISMAIFGSVGFFSERTGLPSFELVFVRCICATLFLGTLWFLTGAAKREVWQRKEIQQILLCGVFLVFNWVFLFKSFEMMSVTVGITLYHLAPVIVLFVGSFIYREKLSWQAVIALAVCFIGIVLIMGVTSGTDFVASGFHWAILAALFYAMTTLLGKGIHKTSAYAVTFIQTALGIALLWPFVDFHAYSYLTTANWLATIVTGFVHTGFVYYLFFNSLRGLSAQAIAILVFVDPLVAILLDVVITGFVPTVWQTVGIIAIFASMALSMKRKVIG